MARSKIGQGSTFRFDARFGPGPQAPPEPAGSGDLVQGVRVLIVDDEPVHRLSLQETLSGWGMIPTPVDGGAAALDELKRAAGNHKPYRVVLVDATLPQMDGCALAGRVREDPDLAGSVLILLSPVSSSTESQRNGDAGIARCLAKPVKQSALRQAILAVLGREVPDADRAAAPPPRQRPARSLRILLAEDTLVNQMVAVRLLQRRGHTVVVAGNGREAVQAYETAESPGFDLVLMDVWMPEMDGFEATAAIRRVERARGGHVPILAMTASAMKGDRERCLAAGMDGYLTKPMRALELYEAVEAAALPQAASGLEFIPLQK